MSNPNTCECPVTKGIERRAVYCTQCWDCLRIENITWILKAQGNLKPQTKAF